MLNLDKKQKYLLACSYGPDSMALFSMLLKEGYSFSAAIVNYHLRKESDLEKTNLEKYCKENNVEFFFYDVKEQIKNNIEEKCRQIRYDFFLNLYKTNNFSCLVVAHNLDDLLETYLLQKKRNIIPNYYGLLEETYYEEMPVKRPLLNWLKLDLQEYCDKNSVPYAIDKSNLTDSFERNKIRHQVIEKMDTDEKNNLLIKIKEENIRLREARAAINNINPDITSLLKLNDFELSIFLNESIDKISKKCELSMRFIREIRRIMLSKKPNVMIKLNNGVLFYKEYDKVGFILDKDYSFSYVIDKPCKMDNEFFFFDFTKNSSNRNVSLSDYPLTIRNIKKDDVYRINGYLVKASRLLIDWKMPLRLRMRWPVIESKDGSVIYIPRYNSNFVPSGKDNFVVK